MYKFKIMIFLMWHYVAWYDKCTSDWEQYAAFFFKTYEEHVASHNINIHHHEILKSLAKVQLHFKFKDCLIPYKFIPH